MNSMNIQRVIDIKGSTDVLSVPQNTTISELVKRACEINIGAFLITDDNGKLAGIVSERDVMHQVNAGTDFENTPVSEVMTTGIISAKPEDDINIAMDLMVSKRIRHLPVLSDHKIEGLITVRDLIHAMRKADEDELRQLVEYLQETVDSEPTA